MLAFLTCSYWHSCLVVIHHSLLSLAKTVGKKNPVIGQRLKQVPRSKEWGLNLRFGKGPRCKGPRLLEELWKSSRADHGGSWCLFSSRIKQWVLKDLLGLVQRDTERNQTHEGSAWCGRGGLGMGCGLGPGLWQGPILGSRQLLQVQEARRVANSL
jgi:hypothetical protein